MSIEKLIRKALSETGMKTRFIRRGSDSLPALIYNYTSVPAYYADNTCKGNLYTVTVNAFVDKNIEKTKNLVISAMENYGFTHTLTSATYVEDSGMYDTPIQFKIFIRKEDEDNV